MSVNGPGVRFRHVRSLDLSEMWMYEFCCVTNVTRAMRGFLGAADTVVTGAGFFAIEAAGSFCSSAMPGLRSGGGGGRDAGAGAGSGSGDDEVKRQPRKPQKMRRRRRVGGILSDRTSIVRMGRRAGCLSAWRAGSGLPSRDAPLTAKYVRAEGYYRWRQLRGSRPSAGLDERKQAGITIVYQANGGIGRRPGAHCQSGVLL